MRYILLALCVLSMGSLAHSQVELTSQEARTIIAKLDTLAYLRAGYAMLDSMVQSLKAQIAIQDSIIGVKDKQNETTMAMLADRERRLVGMQSSLSLWKTATIVGGTTSVILAIICIIGGR